MENYAYQQEALYVYAGLAAATFLLSGWIMRRWWAVVRITLLSLVAALAFTPTFVIPDKDLVAPAVVHLVFDSALAFQKGGIAELQATALKDLKPIALVWGTLFVLGWLLHWLLPKSRAEVNEELDRNAFDKRLAEETGAEPRRGPKRDTHRKDEAARQNADARVRERIEPGFRSPQATRRRER